MDLKKRQSLKCIATVAVASSGLLMANNTLAANSYSCDINNDAVDTTLSTLQVHTRVSSSTNDIEVVITNTGDHTARITQMTPSQTITQRGVFDFAQLMNHGDLVLETGESVSVQMAQHPTTPVKPADRVRGALSLTKSLRISFSVITDNSAFARVDVLDSLKLA